MVECARLESACSERNPGFESLPLRNTFLVYQQYSVSNHNLYHNTDGLSHLCPSFFVPLFTLFFDKITLNLSKFCQNLCKPFQGMTIYLKWLFCIFGGDPAVKYNE